MRTAANSWNVTVDRVVIQTTNYLNFDGSSSAGGRQRHIRDIATVAGALWQRDVVIVQKATHDFHTHCEHGFRVVGVRSVLSAYGDPGFSYKVRRLLAERDGLLYASGDDAWPFFAPNAKSIQHGVWWDGPQSKWVRSVQKRRALACLRRVRSVLCVDTNFINWLRCQGAEGLSLCNKCLYVPNYADLSALQISPPEKSYPIRLICARRYEEKRGVALFIEVLRILKQQGFPFRAHLSTIGGLEEIRRLLARNELEREVSVSEDTMDEVQKRYCSADLAVLPTIWSEGTSLACVEAICSGVPVVATPVGGLGNLIIPGFNGFLVQPGANAIAEAIGRFSDLALLSRMRANCLAMRESLSLHHWRRRVLTWLQD